MTRLQVLIVSALFLWCPSLKAQDIEAYKKQVESSSNPQEKLTAMDSIIKWTRRVDPDTFSEYSLAYIELAKEMDSIEAAARKLINVSYTLTNIKNEPHKVLTLIDGILARKYKIKDSYIVGSLHLKRGAANYRLDLEQAVKDYQNAIDNYSAKDSLYVADAHLFSGQAYSNLGKFVPAGESYKKAYEYFESLKDYEYMYYARQGVTAMFSMNGFYKKAKEEREKNIEKIKELNLEHHLVTTYYNQALDYQKQGNKQLYLENLLKAEDAIYAVPEGKVNNTNKIYVYANLVEYYADANIMGKAQAYLEMLEENIDPGTEDLVNISMHNFAKANYHFALGEFSTALKHANKKLEAAEKLKFEEDIMSAHKLLSKIYAENDDYKNAYASKKKYNDIKDSIFNKTTSNTLAYYQTLYETEKKENELIEKNTSIQLLEKDNESAKRRSLYVSILLVSIFGMVILYRNRMRINNKKLLQEKFSQELLVSQEEERKRISKDLHDGLGQRLLLIKNKVIKNEDPETKALVETAIEEVRGISRNLHPFQLQELGITKAIETTIDQIDENTTLFISSEIDNIDNLFNKKQEVNLYRIVQESLSNILKHAKAEAGKVVIKRETQSVKLVIRDNGIGFDFSQKLQNRRSLGLKTLLERTKFLKGHMRINSKKNHGTILEFQFPIA
ncbi:histidine kinase [Aureisphaera galaxeae]|uniref:tetratricopeptide repeat-containing sensor histidine kinase n=1 Tax=Aureisphaera galaxeae TaxID=1538023 RepID=UPI00235032DA|nr:ATP-binding protein [Aureisphaera galaxeae]MDC8005927.1 histidine kinase [Aureisphaera galaxeae]